MSSNLSGQNLTCIRGNRLVFSSLNFDLKKGGALLLTGPNGSGKTSLLRLMAGLGKPITGIVKRDGIDIYDDLQLHHKCINYVADYDANKSTLTVQENLDFWSKLHGDQKVLSGLKAFDLESLADLPARFLSTGQMRRLALARLAAINADIWLLDEPTIALDTGSVDCLRRLINNHRHNGGAVVAATHVELGLENAEALDMSRYVKNGVSK